MPIRKKLPNSPIRDDKVKEAQEYIILAQLEEATATAKLFFLFVKRTKRADGLSMNELALILHPDKTYLDEKTGQVKPTPEGYRQAKQEVGQLRKDMKNHGVILYSIIDKETGSYYYFNIPTKALFDIVSDHMERIIKGMKKNKKTAYDLLGIPKKERTKLSKFSGDRLRRELMKRLAAQLDKKRKKELEKLLEEQESKQSSAAEASKEGDESTNE